MDNYPNAYKEVYEILKYVKKEDFDKIPKEFVQMVESKMNKQYEFKYDSTIEFENCNILKETKAILAYIFIHYWGSEEQVKKIKLKYRQDLIKEEEDKKIKYSYTDIFKPKVVEENQKSIQIIEKKRKNIFINIINKIKKYI